LSEDGKSSEEEYAGANAGYVKGRVLEAVRGAPLVAPLTARLAQAGLSFHPAVRAAVEAAR
jgi:hypothetical protein